MINLFLPNGITSAKVIYKLAREEYGEIIQPSSNYVSIKRDIIKALRKMGAEEREENRLDTLVGIEHIRQNDFGNFVSVRFAYWGMMIAVAAMIIGDIPIYNYFNMSKRSFGNVVMIALIIILVIMARTIHYQHDQLEYLNFKLICFEEILGNKKKS